MIFKSVPTLDSLCHLADIVSCQHAHYFAYLEAANISLIDLISLKEDLVYQSLCGSRFKYISLTGFPAQSVGSSNTYVLDLPCLLVLITGMSQSRQHGKSESDSYYLSD
ncbi:hypothetical protein Tco_0163285 [Tanacetum coccineum]